MTELEALKRKLQEATTTASKYDKAERERLELSKKVQTLEAQVAESKALREEHLKLSGVDAELQALKTRFVAAEEARDRALVSKKVDLSCSHFCSHKFPLSLSPPSGRGLASLSDALQPGGPPRAGGGGQRVPEHGPRAAEEAGGCTVHPPTPLPLHTGHLQQQQ